MLKPKPKRKETAPGEWIGPCRAFLESSFRALSKHKFFLVNRRRGRRKHTKMTVRMPMSRAGTMANGEAMLARETEKIVERGPRSEGSIHNADGNEHDEMLVDEEWAVEITKAVCDKDFANLSVRRSLNAIPNMEL